MIDEYEDIAVDSDFALDMNCDIEDGKTLRGPFKQNLSVESSNNSNYCNLGKMLRVIEEATGESKGTLKKLNEHAFHNSLKNWRDLCCCSRKRRHSEL